MLNEHVIIIALALLVYFLVWGGKAGWVAAALSIIMVVGALRHPEIATAKPMEGTPEENLYAVMVVAGAIVLLPLAWWRIKLLLRRGGRR